MKKGEQEDAVLIQDVLNGNRWAEEKLYDKYKKIVENFIRKKHSNYYDVDDDVSEVMIRVFLNLKSFDESKSKFNSWVLSIAKNYMIDKWRCASVTLTSYNYSNTGDYLLLNCNTATNPLNDTNTVSTSYCSNIDNCSSVNYISTQLSPSDFSLLDMKYVQGYDYNEIGKEFNLTSSTISNKINYIKTKLKKNNSDLI